MSGKDDDPSIVGLDTVMVCRSRGDDVERGVLVVIWTIDSASMGYSIVSIVKKVRRMRHETYR